MFEREHFALSHVSESKNYITMAQANSTLDLPPLHEPPEAPWVTEMKKHFADTGSYRPEDLQRLLGPPWLELP
jgi:hypothetical protein